MLSNLVMPRKQNRYKLSGVWVLIVTQYSAVHCQACMRKNTDDAMMQNGFGEDLFIKETEGLTCTFTLYNKPYHISSMVMTMRQLFSDCH